jgi:hypothetical protein
VLANSSYTVQQGSGPLVVAAPGPLGNVADPDGDNVYMDVPSSPSNGWLVPYLNGSFVYTPSAGFSGLISFTFRAYETQGGSSLGTVTINVTKGARHCWHVSLTNLA